MLTNAIIKTLNSGGSWTQFQKREHILISFIITITHFSTRYQTNVCKLFQKNTTRSRQSRKILNEEELTRPREQRVVTFAIVTADMRESVLVNLSIIINTLCEIKVSCF